MSHILTYQTPDQQQRYISCFSVNPPAKASYSSSERLQDAVVLPYNVALGACDMLNGRWNIGCDILHVHYDSDLNRLEVSQHG